MPKHYAFLAPVMASVLRRKMTDLNENQQEEADDGAAVLNELHVVHMRVAHKYGERWKKAGFWRRLWLRYKIAREMDEEVSRKPWGKEAGPVRFSDEFMNNIAEQDAPADTDNPRR